MITAPLPRASPSGSGRLSMIIPQNHGLTITYIYIYIWTPRPITLPRSRCACGVMTDKVTTVTLSRMRAEG